MGIQTIDPATLPLREQLFVAGAFCSVSTNSHVLIESLAHWKCSPPDAPARSFELAVRVHSSGSGWRAAVPHFRGMHHLVFATFGERDLFVFDLLRRTAAGVVCQKTAEDACFWKHLLIPVAIGVIGTTMGLIPLHAACLDWRGAGLMIFGESEAGKSTLAVELSRRGFSLVSDEWTYIAEANSRTTAYGITAPVKLLADAPRLFPELSRCKPSKSLNGEIAFEVDAAQVFGSATRSQSSPHWLIFLKRSERPGCELLPYGRDETRNFFEQSAERLPAQFAEIAAQRSQTIARLVQQDCRVLLYGGPPQVAADALEKFCKGADLCH